MMSNFSRLLGIVPKFSSTLSSMMSLNTSKSAPWYLPFIHLNRPYSPRKYSAFRLKASGSGTLVERPSKGVRSTTQLNRQCRKCIRRQYPAGLRRNHLPKSGIYLLFEKTPKLRFLYKETLTVITFEKNCLSHKT